MCNFSFFFSQIFHRKDLISKVFIPVESIYSYEVNHPVTLSPATPTLMPMRPVLTQESPAAPADCHDANNGA